MNTPLTAAQVAYLPSAIKTAVVAGQAYVHANPENEANWFPCGFVWLTYRCRKNSKEGKVLAAMGFRWSDYDKQFQHSFYEISRTQSMCYRENVIGAMRDSLHSNGFPGFAMASRID